MQIAARNDGHGIAHVTSQLNVEIVLVGKQIGSRRSHVAFDRGGSPREKEHDVLAEFRQLPFVPRPEPLPHTNQQQKRADSPGNAEHGQERAQLVRPQIAKDLGEDVGDTTHKRKTRQLSDCHCGAENPNVQVLLRVTSVGPERFPKRSGGSMQVLPGSYGSLWTFSAGAPRNTRFGSNPIESAMPPITQPAARIAGRLKAQAAQQPSAGARMT